MNSPGVAPPLRAGTTRDAGSISPLTHFVPGEEPFQHDPDRLLLVEVEVLGGLESEAKRLIGGQALVGVEDECVGRDREPDCQTSKDPEARFRRAGFVAPELGDVDLGSFGQCDLGQPAGAPQLGEVIGERHGPHATGSGGRSHEQVLYNRAYQAVSDHEPGAAMQPPEPTEPPVLFSTSQDGTVARAFDPDGTDAALLRAVADHWHECLMTSDERDVILSSLGISADTAVALRIGLSDRTLGKRIPGRQWKAGLALRSRLCELGIMRRSGHEAFRGCVVVPVVDFSGSIVGVFGNRIDPRFEGARAAVWAHGLPGGIFTAGETATSTVVVPTILDALSLIGAGCRSVVAPGREKGFTDKELATLAGRPGELVVMGRDTAKLAADLSSLGTSVAVAGTDVVLPVVLGSSAVPGDALAALLADCQDFRPSTDPMGTGAVPVSRRADPPTVVATEGRDETFVHSGLRSWRIRGAGARGNTEGDLLRVALSVTDSATGRFHLDTLDLYAARQRTHFLDAAVTELRCDRETLSAELAEVLHAAERCRDEAGSKKQAPTPVMTDAERDDAMAWLTSPDLIGRLGADLAALGVVGEQTNLVVCYLATISRLCERPFGVVVQSSSAAGKSTLTDAVCSLVPSEDLVSLSAITSQALYYLGGGDLSRKVLAVAEEQGAARASYALKLLVSEGRLSIASTGKDRSTGRLATASYEIAGPVALVMTTTATDIDPELENRLVVLGVDEDASQTQAILGSCGMNVGNFTGMTRKFSL